MSRGTWGSCRTHRRKLSTVLHAVMEVRRPSIFGELIIALTFLPIITLEGMEGKMFSPLAITVSIALFASLFLSVFITPVSVRLYPQTGCREAESLLWNWIKKVYLWALDLRMRAAGSDCGRICSADFRGSAPDSAVGNGVYPGHG